MTDIEYLKNKVTVDPITNCWMWNLSTNGRYGRLCRFKQKWFAHRFSFTIHKGPIEKGLSVCHTCDQPLCCNPDHLFLGTQQDNLKDMRQKGRGFIPEPPKGISHHNSKINLQIANKIRELVTNGMFRQDAGALYNISGNQVTRIMRNKAWKNP